MFYNEIIDTPCYKYIYRNIDTEADQLVLARNYFEHCKKRKLSVDDALINYASICSLKDSELSPYMYKGTILDSNTFYDCVMSDSTLQIHKNCSEYIKQFGPEMQSVCKCCPFKKKNSTLELEMGVLRTINISLSFYNQFALIADHRFFKSHLDLASDFNSPKPVVAPVFQIAFKMITNLGLDYYSVDGDRNRLELLGTSVLSEIKKQVSTYNQLLTFEKGTTDKLWSIIVDEIMNSKELSIDAIKEYVEKAKKTSSKKKTDTSESINFQISDILADLENAETNTSDSDNIIDFNKTDTDTEESKTSTDTDVKNDAAVTDASADISMQTTNNEKSNPEPDINNDIDPSGFSDADILDENSDSVNSDIYMSISGEALDEEGTDLEIARENATYNQQDNDLVGNSAGNEVNEDVQSGNNSDVNNASDSNMPQNTVDDNPPSISSANDNTDAASDKTEEHKDIQNDTSDKPVLEENGMYSAPPPAEQLPFDNTDGNNAESDESNGTSDSSISSENSGEGTENTENKAENTDTSDDITNGKEHVQIPEYDGPTSFGTELLFKPVLPLKWIKGIVGRYEDYEQKIVLEYIYYRIIPVEVIDNGDGHFYYLMWFQNEHSDKGRFLYSFVEKIPASLAALLKSKKVVKICYQPYYMYSISKLHGNHIGNLHSIYSADALLYKDYATAPYKDIMPLYFNKLKPLPPINSGITYIDTLLEYIRGYRQIYWMYIRGGLLRDNNTKLAKAYQSLLLEDEVLGMSYLRCTCSKDNGVLFKIASNGILVYTEEFDQKYSVPGYVVTFAIKNEHLDKTKLYPIYLSLLKYFAEAGKFQKYNIQIITFAEDKMILFVEDRIYSYFMTRIQFKFDRVALENEDLGEFEFIASHERVGKDEGSYNHIPLPQNIDTIMDVAVTPNAVVEVDSSHITGPTQKKQRVAKGTYPKKISKN